MKTLVSIIAFMLLTSMGQQSQVTIKGRVTDLTVIPLSGVTVMVKETNNSTLTGPDGTYVITAGPGAKTLVFSLKGMKPLEEPISGRTVINVVMEPEKPSKQENKEKKPVVDQVMACRRSTSSNAEMSRGIRAGYTCRIPFGKLCKGLMAPAAALP